jgi:hypothetical protein
MFLEMKMSIFKFRKSEKELYKGKRDFFKYLHNIKKS